MTDTEPSPAGRRPRDRTFLLLVTAAAAVLRFAFLSHPTLWNDEALTYSRVCGTHAQMIDVLKDDAFGPLHYELDWLLGHLVTLTPFMLRLIPAVAGTLLVPAIYLLGRELFDRRVGRLSAVLACGSAFLLAYGRDAKMYMELWLAVTLHVGLLLTALGTGRPWAWGGWLLAGTAAVWLHAAGFALLPLDLLILLLHPRGTVARTAGVLVGLAAVLAGPAWYVLAVSRVPKDFRSHGWGATGIGWVGGRTDGHTGTALLADTATSFAFGFSWIEERFGRAVPPKWMMATAAGLLIAFATVGCLAAFVRRRDEVDWDEADAPTRRRSGLLLWAWVAVPVYATYRITLPDAASATSMLAGLSPLAWAAVVAVVVGCWYAKLPRSETLFRGGIVATTVVAAAGWAVRGTLGDLDSPVRPPSVLSSEGQTAIAVVAAAVCGLCWLLAGGTTRQRLGRGLRAAGVVAVAVVLCLAIDRACRHSRSGSIWIPRYLGVVYPAVVVGAAALLFRLRWPAVRWAAVGLLLAVNLAQAAAHVFVASEPPVDRVAADVLASVDSNFRTATFPALPHLRYGPHGMGSMYNTCGLYYLVLDSGRHLTPAQFHHGIPSQFFPVRNIVGGPLQPAAIAATCPDATRLILWDRLDPRTTAAEPMPAPPHWSLDESDVYPVRSFWDWGTLYLYRRTVYVRSDR